MSVFVRVSQLRDGGTQGPSDTAITVMTTPVLASALGLAAGV